MAQWYVVRSGKEHGPHTAQALKEMAASGELRPADLVRREDMPSARPASTVKGLFPGEDAGTGAAPPAAKVAKPPVTAERRSQPDDSPGTMSGARMKLIVLSAVAGVLFLACAGVVGVLATKARKAAEQGLAEADRAWDAGDKAGAASQYRNLLQDRGRKAALKPDEKARLFGRLIDFDAERGEVESAKALLEEAASGNVTPQVGHPEGLKLLAAHQRQQAADTDRQYVWKQPEGWWGDVLKTSDLRFRPMPADEYAGLVYALNDRTAPERVAKLLQHADPHALFTREELQVMAKPYYGTVNWSGNVLDAAHPDPHVELKSKAGRKDQFREPVFLVSGDPNDGNGVAGGRFFRSFSLKDDRRTKLVEKAVGVALDFNYTGPDLKKTGIKAARLGWIKIHIPAIHNDEKCYGWDAVIEPSGTAVAGVRFVELRAERLGPLADPKFGPTDIDLYQIRYDSGDPARPYTIEKLVPKMETIRGK